MNYTQYYKMIISDPEEQYDVERFNTNSDIIDNAMAELSAGGDQDFGVVECNVTLSVNNWDSEAKTQTVTVTGVTSDSIVIPGFSMGTNPTQLIRAMNARIIIVSVGTNTITVKASKTLPDADIPYSFAFLPKTTNGA